MARCRIKRQKLPEAVRRAKIVEAARMLFVTRGYERTRMDDIAAEAGLTKGGVYFHFKDKKALFEVVVTQRINDLESNMDAVDRAEYDPVELIRRFFAAIVADVKPDLTRADGSEAGPLDIFLEANRIPETRIRLQSFFGKVRSFLEENIREGQRLGLIGDVDVEAASLGAMAAMQGFIVQYMQDPGAFDLEEMAKRVSEHYIRGLTRK